MRSLFELSLCLACGLIGNPFSTRFVQTGENQSGLLSSKFDTELVYFFQRKTTPNRKNPTSSSTSNKPKIEIFRPNNLSAFYVNAFRIQSQPSELIVVFGVNTTSKKRGTTLFETQYRIALNYYTAKRMAAALEMAINRHEATFGKLKTFEPKESIELEKQAGIEYANFARVSSTPEELILDFGLNRQPYSKRRMKIVIAHTVVMLHPTAKRLFLALQQTLAKYEKKHGVIETDIRKRVAPKYE